MRLDVGALTDKGLKRKVNEDSILVNESAALFAVCDGVGGRNAGDRASSLAAGTLERSVSAGGASDLEGQIAGLEAAIAASHREILRAQTTAPSLKGMATTVAALKVWKRFAVVAHVGDCRVYRVRGEGLQLITRDDSKVQGMVDRGELSSEQAETSRERNVITRSLGVGNELGTVDVHVLTVSPGDTFVLASDGITSYVSASDIHRSLVGQQLSVQQACERYRDMAYDGGAHDNLSVIVVRIEGADESSGIETLATIATASG